MLNIKHPSYYDGSFPTFRKPSEIGVFSLDGERKFHDDGNQRKYIIIPQRLKGLNMDLNTGYREAIRKDFGKREKIDILLTWILRHQDEVSKIFKDSSNRTQIDFVCFRGLLTAICASVYENKEDWLICATKYKSVIYLCAFDTDANIQRRETASERDKLMSSWGYKFEQYMTANTPTSQPDLSVPVNEKEEYCIVLKGRLTHHTLLFSAEVDGVNPEYMKNHQHNQSSTARYMELKTSRIITSDRQHANFCRFKLLKWWLQSFLVGISMVVCGFRDDNGIAKELGMFPVADMPKMAQSFWSPSACLNFCAEFLDFVQANVVKDDPNIVYKFYWKPGNPVKCEELSSPGEYRILPYWYTRAASL